MKRVVVTGVGAVTPLGVGKEAFWEALIRGKSGVGPITCFDTAGFSTTIAAEVKDFSPTDYLEKKEVRRLDRFVQFAAVAARMAVADANLEIKKEDDNENMGVIVGSGIGGIRTIAEQFNVLKEKGPGRVSPFLVPMLIANMASGYISILLGLRGPNSTVVTACATGTHAIGDAFRLIQRGEADVMLAGGAEAPLTPIAVAGFCAARALSTRNDDPARASRPFDREREGFVMGEGAGVVVLESMEHARARDARCYAEVIGYGMTGDAYHVTAPEPQGRGAVSCMKKALADARLRISEIDYINAHGTSTVYNDKIETHAIKKVFADRAYAIPISSIKSMTGHLLGAAGGVEAMATVLSIYHGIIPPTINYEFPDPDCDLDYVPNLAREKTIKAALSNSFGFGGTNACLVFKKV